MKLSMSGVERALACIPSIVLPHSRTESAASTLGTVVHEYLAHVAAQGAEAALALVPQEHRRACEAIDLSALPACEPEAYASEVAFLYDVEADTAREVGRGLGRKYPPHGPHEVPGTADVVGATEDAVLVFDYKTGFGDVTPAAQNAQLRGYALAAARAYGKRRAVVAIIRLRDGEAWYDRAELDELDLDAAAAELRALHERAQDEAGRLELGDAPRTSEGAHCRYCPAFHACPAKVTLLRELAVTSSAEQLLPELSPETAPRVLERLEAYEAVLERARAILEDYARGTPIALPDGEVFGPVALARETLDATKGGILLTGRFGEKVATESIEMEPTLTKGRLKEALRGWMKEHPGNKISKLEAEALDLLREGGAVKTALSYPVRRHTPKEDALPVPEEARKPKAKKAAKALAPETQAAEALVAGMGSQEDLGGNDSPEVANAGTSREGTCAACGFASKPLSERGCCFKCDPAAMTLAESAEQAAEEEEREGRPPEPVTDGPGWVMVACRACGEPLGMRPPGSSIHESLCPRRDAHGTAAEGFAPPEQDAFTAPF